MRAALGVLACISTALAAGDSPTHLLRAEQPNAAPTHARLAVEIPAGSRIKYEIGEDGLVHVSRFLSMPVAYPANYGSIPRSLAGDGDPLDALVFTRDALHPGTLIEFRPIGVLRMRDDGDEDDKIIGVPTDKIDPTYAGIRELSDLPAIERERLDAFFRVYKQLPAGGEPAIELLGFGDAAQAKALIAAALDRYRTSRAGEQVAAGAATIKDPAAAAD